MSDLRASEASACRLHEREAWADANFDLVILAACQSAVNPFLDFQTAQAAALAGLEDPAQCLPLRRGRDASYVVVKGKRTQN